MAEAAFFLTRDREINKNQIKRCRFRSIPVPTGHPRGAPRFAFRTRSRETRPRCPDRERDASQLSRESGSDFSLLTLFSHDYLHDTRTPRAPHTRITRTRVPSRARMQARALAAAHTCNGGSHLQFWGVMHPLMRVHRHPTSSVMRIRRTSRVVSVARPRPTSEHLPRPHLVVAACAVGAMGPPTHRLQAHP